MVVADQLSPAVAVGRVEVERHAVDRQAVAELVAARLPFLADDAVHRVTRAVHPRPGAERLLDLGVEPLLGVDPPLHHPEVDLPECAGALECGQLGEGDLGVVVVHLEQEHPGDAPVQGRGALEKGDPVVVGQVESCGDERDLLPLAGQPLELDQCRSRRVGGEHPVVRGEPAVQVGGRGPEILRVGVDDQQHRRTSSVGGRAALLGGAARCAHGAVTGLPAVPIEGGRDAVVHTRTVGPGTERLQGCCVPNRPHLRRPSRHAGARSRRPPEPQPLEDPCRADRPLS